MKRRLSLSESEGNYFQSEETDSSSTCLGQLPLFLSLSLHQLMVFKQTSKVRITIQSSSIALTQD